MTRTDLKNKANLLLAMSASCFGIGASLAQLSALEKDDDTKRQIYIIASQIAHLFGLCTSFTIRYAYRPIDLSQLPEIMNTLPQTTLPQTIIAQPENNRNVYTGESQSTPNIRANSPIEFHDIRPELHVNGRPVIHTMPVRMV